MQAFNKARSGVLVFLLRIAIRIANPFFKSKEIHATFSLEHAVDFCKVNYNYINSNLERTHPFYFCS